jgi:hypothetical protein
VGEEDERKGVGSRQVESMEGVNASKMGFRSVIGVMSMEVNSKALDKLVATEEGEVVVLFNARLIKLIVAKMAGYKINFLALQSNTAKLEIICLLSLSFSSSLCPSISLGYMLAFLVFQALPQYFSDFKISLVQ